jgi:hypothetical protein
MIISVVDVALIVGQGWLYQQKQSDGRGIVVVPRSLQVAQWWVLFSSHCPLSFSLFFRLKGDTSNNPIPSTRKLFRAEDWGKY